MKSLSLNKFHRKVMCKRLRMKLDYKTKSKLIYWTIKIIVCYIQADDKNITCLGFSRQFQPSNTFKFWYKTITKQHTPSTYKLTNNNTNDELESWTWRQYSKLLFLIRWLLFDAEILYTFEFELNANGMWVKRRENKKNKKKNNSIEVSNWSITKQFSTHLLEILCKSR